MMNLHFITVLFIWINSNAPVRAQRTAVVFLTRKVNSQTTAFAQSLAKNASEYNMDIYIVIDNKNTTETVVQYLNMTDIRLLDVAAAQCRQSGYQHMISITLSKNNVSSWDKAFFYFNVLNRNYSFLWMIEDDVFMANTRAFLAMHSLYAGTSDVLVARNRFNRVGNTSFWLWERAIGLFVPPWSWSMVNVVGLSRRLLDKMDEYVRWRGRLPFHEQFFNTLAIHENLTLRIPYEMDDLYYRMTHTYKQVVKKPSNFWHPVKNLGMHNSWRQKLLREKSLRWRPVNFTDLPSVCEDQPADGNTTVKEEYLKTLVARFEQMKTFYRPDQRLSIREEVMDAFQQCQHQNTSVEILRLLLLLADHAHRQPEVFEKEIVQEKSRLHRQLEKALRRNKEIVLKLVARNLSETPRVQKLRANAFNLTILLVAEIQREVEEETKRKEKPSIIERKVENNRTKVSSDRWWKSFLLFPLTFLLFCFICRRRNFRVKSVLCRVLFFK